MQIKFVADRDRTTLPSLLFDSREIAFMLLMEKREIYFEIGKVVIVMFSLLQILQFSQAPLVQYAFFVCLIELN